MRAIALAVVLLISAAAVADGGPAPPRQLWLYYATNLQVDRNIADLEPIWRRAAAAGYSHILLSDGKLARLGDLGEMTAHYTANARRAKALADSLHLQIVPAIFPIGYSGPLLWHNPNLAEGLPVRDALLVIHHNTAELLPDPPVALSVKPVLVDPTVQWSAAQAVVRDPAANARFAYRLAVSPFRCYHISVRIKTEDFTGSPRVAVLARERSLNFCPLDVKPSQEWTVHDIVFNSLDHKEVTIYFGQWGAARGTLMWKDWTIEEAGPVNLLRRPGTPLTVKIESGHLLTEGRDFDHVVDPRMGNVPWKGEYEVWHAAPPIHTHNLPDGTRLRVSWFHPIQTEAHAVMVCLSAPELPALLKDEVARVSGLLSPTGFMMSHDEIRCMNWDDACAARHLTPGELLAGNARLCTSLIPPNAAVYVWSDMFDPYHNAHDNYYLVNGDLAGSWQGLDPRRVTIINWNFGHRAESLKFFADRGHAQILAGYYDGQPQQVLQWLDAAKDVPGIDGVMYTTWQNRYGDLEKFAQLVREH